MPLVIRKKPGTRALPTKPVQEDWPVDVKLGDFVSRSFKPTAFVDVLQHRIRDAWLDRNWEEQIATEVYAHMVTAVQRAVNDDDKFKDGKSMDAVTSCIIHEIAAERTPAEMRTHVLRAFADALLNVAGYI